MADITNPTSNVTIYDESGNIAEVNDDNELLVHDQKSLELTGLNEWQIDVRGGRGFGTITPLITISGQAETDYLLIRNPSGSGLTLKLKEVVYTYDKGSGVSFVRFYTSPTVGAVGTAQTIYPMNPASVITPTMLVYYAPTITTRGSLERVFGQSATGSLIRDYDLGYYLEEGADWLLTVDPAANNTDHSITFAWSEE